MKFIVCENYEEMSKTAAEYLFAQIKLKPDSNLGLATGSTPIGMYKHLIEMGPDFSNVTTFNLDEYYPIKRDNDQSYHYFMTDNLYSKVNLKAENIHIPNGETETPEEECEAYDKTIDEHGGIDIQVLGIGQNGHIGFNEPGKSMYAFTHITDLTENTIQANSRFFESEDDVPKKALTMGVATIMKAKKIILLASGKEKIKAIEALKGNMIDPEIPATILLAHNDVTVILDKAANGCE